MQILLINFSIMAIGKKFRLTFRCLWLIDEHLKSVDASKVVCYENFTCVVVVLCESFSTLRVIKEKKILLIFLS